MPVIEVERAFTLTQQDGTQRQFLAGRHEVPDDIASHWYVRHHLKDATDAPPAPGTPEAAEAARLAAAHAHENASVAATREATRAAIAAGDKTQPDPIVAGLTDGRDPNVATGTVAAATSQQPDGQRRTPTSEQIDEAARREQEHAAQANAGQKEARGERGDDDDKPGGRRGRSTG